MPGVDYHAARAQLRLAAVLELLGLRAWQRRGDQVRGRCLVQGSRTATSRSFAAHLGKNVWHCLTCDAGGHALDLWAAVTRQEWHAAVLDLCERLGCAVPWLPANGRKIL